MVAALALLAAAPVCAATGPSRNPVLLSADQITFDQELGVVVATGHVEISQDDNVVLADSLTYNRRTNTVTASGNVSLLEAGGSVLFADYVELTDDLRDGVITNIRLLLSDRSRLAAAAGRRSGGNRTEVTRAVYSPCELCKKDPTRAPLWQIKAAKVVHDEVTHTIQYHDASMEIFGVPVAYMPYFQHPDPSVKRQTGVLRPNFGSSGNLGYSVKLPFFWAIAPDRDATITPFITTKQGLVMIGEYRQRFPSGEVRLGGSGTVADRSESSGGNNDVHHDEFRGHIDSSGRFDISDYWRWGFDANRATDKTYLRFYDFDSSRTLTSRLFAEGFHARNYASLRSFAFQGLRDTDNNDEQPIVAPLMDYNFVGEPAPHGGYFTFDANAMALTRIEGRDSRRLSIRTAWTLPYTAPEGDIYTLTASLEGDGYWVDGVDPHSNDPDPSGNTFSGFAGRILPQASLEWRYPFVRHHERFDQVFEPIVSLVASPPDMNSGRIPNEDSLDVEFDDTNVFELNRFSGIDRIDSGQRINYGVKWSVFGDGGGSTSLFVGQSYQLNDDNAFPRGSGLEDQLSDIVGRLQISPNENLDLLYRFRFDATSGNLRRNELGLRAGTRALNLSLNYAFLDEASGSGSNFGDRQEISGVVRSRVTQNWSGFVAARRDLEKDEMLSYGGGLSYHDECIQIDFSATRRRFRDEEVKPDIQFLLAVTLRNLGQIGGEF